MSPPTTMRAESSAIVACSRHPDQLYRVPRSCYSNKGRESLWMSSKQVSKNGVGVRKGKVKLVLWARHSQRDSEDDFRSDCKVIYC